MRFFAITFLLILAFAMAFDRSSSAPDLKTVKIGEFKIPRPFDREAISASNSIEAITIGNTYCQNSVCSFLDSYECVASEIVDENPAVPASLKSTVLGCVMDCAGAYYGCSTVDDTTCSAFGFTQSSCEASSFFDDDSTSTDDSSDDDMTVEEFCDNSCYWGAYDALTEVFADCGTEIVWGYNNSALMFNNYCTENAWGDNCMLAVNETEAIVAGIDDGCDAFFDAISDGADACMEIANWGCCTGTAAFAYPPCVSEYLVSECGADLDYKCSKGMFVDVVSVSSSLSLSSYADLNDTWTGYMYINAIAEAVSTGSEMIDYSYVSIPTWMGSMMRRLRGSNADEEQRRLMGSTDMDFSVMFLDGAHISSTGISDAIDSDEFTWAFEALVSNNITTKDMAMSKTYKATSPFDDDAAFSAPLNVVLVLASMFLGLMLF